MRHRCQYIDFALVFGQARHFAPMEPKRFLDYTKLVLNISSDISLVIPTKSSNLPFGVSNKFRRLLGFIDN